MKHTLIRSFLLASCAALSVVAQAQQSFASRAANFNVGVLVLQNPAIPGRTLPSPTPHVWYALDRDTALKPAAWTFTNPRANRSVTQSMIDRWGSANVPALGERLAKSQAGYWEVSLPDVSEQILQSYDVLLMSVSGNLALTPREREKLRRFVDKGGTLWIDLQPGSTTDVLNPSPIPFTIRNSVTALSFDPNNPLVDSPNQVTIDELNALRGTSVLATGPVTNTGGLDASQSWIIPDSRYVVPAVDAGAGNNFLSYGQLGDGYIVISTLGIAATINRGDNSGSIVQNSNFRSARIIRDAYYAAAAKVAVNILALNNSFGGPARGTRKSSSTPVDVPAPLLQRFDSSDVPFAGTTPAHADGKLIIAKGGSLVVLDADPEKDIDGDGDPDDGIIDPVGSLRDILWSVGGDFVTTPVIADLPTVGKVIFCTSSSGAVSAYALDQANPNAPVPLYAPVDPPTAILGGSKVNSPTIHEGLAIMADTDLNQRGRVWAFDPMTGAILKQSGRRNFALENAGRIGIPANAPTVGYIPIQDNSGGLDRVVYVPTARNTTTRVPAGLVSLWLGARSEAPIAVNVNAGTMTIVTRATLQQAPIYDAPGTKWGVKISFQYLDGRPVPDAIVQSVIAGNPSLNASQNGVIEVPVQNMSAATIEVSGPNPNATVRVDYTLDWGAPTSGGFATANSEQFVRGEVQFPDITSPIRDIVGHVALSPSGNIFAVTSVPLSDATNAGGSLWALREEGRGEYKLLYRWELYDDVKITANGGASTSYGPSIVDNDGLLDLVQFAGNRILDQKMVKLKFIGGPIIRDDTVFVGVNGYKKIFGFDSATASIMAFNANPSWAEFQIPNLSANFVISQPDPARTEGVAVQSSFLSVGNYTLEQEDAPTGSGYRTISKVRMTNFMPATRGRIRDSIAVNIPITIRQSGQSEVLVEPEMSSGDARFVGGNAAGRWDPLRWYTIFNGINLTASPVMAGETLYLGGPSYLWSIINTGNPFGGSRGLLYGMTTKPSPSDLLSPSLPHSWMIGGITPRPWQKYLNQVRTSGPGDVSISPYFVWPEFRGVKTFDDLKIRLNQAIIASPTVDGLAVGDNSLTTWGSGVLYGFSRGDFLIADQGRILRVDSTGNPWWSSEETKSSGPDAPVTVSELKANLGQVTRVYSFGSNGYLAVDCGNDRIVRMDSLGRELRSISNLKMDPNYHPSSVGRNPALALRNPRDVTTWTTVIAKANNPLTNAQNYEYWRHWLVADAGNERVVEIVDRYFYDPTTRRIGSVVTYADDLSATGTEKGYGVIYSQVGGALSSRNYAYNSIARATLPTAGGGRQTVFAFGFGNVQPGTRSAGLDVGPQTTDAQNGRGGILIVDPNAGTTEVVTNFSMPAISANVLYNPADAAFDMPAVAAEPNRRFNGLNSVSLHYDGGTLAALVADNSGVYEIQKVGGAWVCEFAIPNDVYTAMRRTNSGAVDGTNAKQLRAMYARHLRNGQVLIVNGYQGQTRSLTNPRSFQGEVLMVSPENFGWNVENFGFTTQSIRFELPPLVGIRDLIGPVFADRP